MSDDPALKQVVGEKSEKSPEVLDEKDLDSVAGGLFGQVRQLFDKYRETAKGMIQSIGR